MCLDFPLHAKFLRRLLPLMLAAALLTACNLPAGPPPTSPPPPAAPTAALIDSQATQDAIQTQIAQAALVAGQAAEMTAQATQAAIQTQVALAAQQTVQAQQPTGAPPTTPPPTEAPAATTPPQETFEAWLPGASILLYEDMAGDYRTTRYIKEALDTLGLRYTDVRDALGNYKDQLLSNGPGGRGWDLIISGKELRTAVSGEFYVYLNDALTQGSSVIIEEWNLNDIGAGKISNILGRCGVEFQADWWNKPTNEQLLWAVEGESPIFHYPNEGISLRNPTNYWRGDLGDLLRLSPGSTATSLWSARTNTRDTYLTAVACLDNRLIIQTYSTHDYGKERIVRMWQNYIYNALRARYDLTHP
ncbi:MAG: hypothetical protein Fur0018_18430 [Anaerolineales bacterium]